MKELALIIKLLTIIQSNQIIETELKVLKKNSEDKAIYLGEK